MTWKLDKYLWQFKMCMIWCLKDIGLFCIRIWSKPKHGSLLNLLDLRVYIYKWSVRVLFAMITHFEISLGSQCYFKFVSRDSSDKQDSKRGKSWVNFGSLISAFKPIGLLCFDSVLSKIIWLVFLCLKKKSLINNILTLMHIVSAICLIDYHISSQCGYYFPIFQKKMGCL